MLATFHGAGCSAHAVGLVEVQGVARCGPWKPRPASNADAYREDHLRNMALLFAMTANAARKPQLPFSPKRQVSHRSRCRGHIASSHSTC
jgi:hypothetical protein